MNQQNPYQPPSAPTQPPPQHPYGQPNQPMVTSRPGTVTAAAILWIIIGGLGILGQLGGLIFGSIAAVLGLLIAIAFLVVGIRTLTGGQKDTLGNAVGSLVFGGMTLLAALGLASTNGAIVLVLILPQAIALVVAGILALSGRQQYRDWYMSRQGY